MSSTSNDVIGKYFGERKVISFSHHNDGGKAFYNTICSCGKKQIIRLDSLKRSSSCGCLNKKQKFRRELYNRWYKIIDRCYNEKNKSYKNYGARGIKVCNEWKNSFDEFYNWSISNGYNPELSIDRIDVGGDYNPSNCRWADIYTQANNRTDNIYIDYYGEKVTLSNLSKILDENYWCLRSRHFRGWSDEEIIKGKRRN